MINRFDTSTQQIDNDTDASNIGPINIPNNVIRPPQAVKLILYTLQKVIA